MGSFCCNYISYFYWSSLLFGICLADILWICQKAFTEWAPPVCLYQMCCILNFHWISSGYFHKTPPNPLFTRHINVIENVIIYLQPHCGHLRAWFSVSKGSQQKWTYILSIYQLFAHMFLRCVVFWPSYRNSFGWRWSFCEFFHLILLDAEAVRDTPSLSINLYLVPEKD